MEHLAVLPLAKPCFFSGIFTLRKKGLPPTSHRPCILLSSQERRRGRILRETAPKSAREDGKVLSEFATVKEDELVEFLNLELESDLKLDQMRHYEVVFLVHEDYLEEVPKVVAKVEEFIKEKNGKIWRLNDWGLRRLAYKIRKARKANYVLVNFEIGSQWVNDFKRMLDKDERVIRHLVMKQDKAITEFCPPPPEFHTLRSSMVDDAGVFTDDSELELEDVDMDMENE